MLNAVDDSNRTLHDQCSFWRDERTGRRMRRVDKTARAGGMARYIPLTVTVTVTQHSNAPFLPDGPPPGALWWRGGVSDLLLLLMLRHCRWRKRLTAENCCAREVLFGVSFSTLALPDLLVLCCWRIESSVQSCMRCRDLVCGVWLRACESCESSSCKSDDQSSGKVKSRLLPSRLFHQPLGHIHSHGEQVNSSTISTITDSTTLSSATPASPRRAYCTVQLDVWRNNHPPHPPSPTTLHPPTSPTSLLHLPPPSARSPPININHMHPSRSNRAQHAETALLRRATSPRSAPGRE